LTTNTLLCHFVRQIYILSNKTERLTTRVTPDEKDKVIKDGEELDMDTSKYIRHRLGLKNKRKKILILLVTMAFLVPLATAQETPRSFEWEIAKGNLPGHEWTGISSHSELVDTTEDVIWCADRAYIFPAVATLMNVSSSDVDDTAGSDGLWNVTIYGLDVNRDPLIEVVQLNGQTPVSTVNEYLRVNRMVGVSAGVTGTNEGDVFIGEGATVAGEPTIIYHVICIEEGWSHVGVYSVKDGYTAFLVRGIFGTDDNKQVTFGVYQRSMSLSDPAWQMTIHFHVDQQYIYPSDFYQPLPPNADILVKASVTVGDASVTSKISILLINTTILHNSTLDWGDGSPSEVIIKEPLDVNIVESIDLMTAEFVVFIVLAFVTMYLAWNTEENRKAALGYAFSTLFWIATMYQWAVDQAGTQSFNLMWLYIAPLSFCIIQFLNKNWFSIDDAEKNMKRNKF